MQQFEGRYNPTLVEEKCNSLWESENVYKWKNTGVPEDRFVIDTPPPTVSGVLHMGHVFSYCHTDFVARFQRMLGKDVLYPMGFDDNGLPTERLVEKVANIKAAQVPREEFIAVCNSVSQKFRAEFKALFRKLGISCDWSLEYNTVSKKIQKLSQESFLILYEKGELYRKQEPILWDVVDQTAIAHAEVEERVMSSHMNVIQFHTVSGEPINIATTRPELMPACVAVFFNPEDGRYAHLRGQVARVPVGGAEVKILPDDRVNIEKGTGLVMCCTFGDETDVHWWRVHNLDTKIIINKFGRLCGLEKFDLPGAKISAARFEGMNIKSAREAMCEALRQEGLLLSREPIEHAVKCAERSGSPLEIVPSDQWFISVVKHKSALLEQIRKVQWHPPHMRKRLEIWVENLNWDWCISRQRYFGVQFPVWYSKRDGEVGKIVLPDKDKLPINPLIDLPSGYDRDEVEADVDVMDTWATSSLSPYFIISNFSGDEGGDVIPADLRAQSHEIIRSWAFYTIIKSHHHHENIPWKNIMISGWCLSDDKTKMSKSKGTAIDPEKILALYGADAVRYWAAKSNLGSDTVFSEDMVKTGKRLTTKLWNASKFVSMFLGDKKTRSHDCTFPTDLWILAKLHTVVHKSTLSFNNYEYSAALGTIETFFWNDFCDNYLELIKHRTYGDHSHEGYTSAVGTLDRVLKAVLLLLSPFLPYVTEEIYRILYKGESVHVQKWPCSSDIPHDQTIERYGDIVVHVMDKVRKEKTMKEVSVKYPVEVLTIWGMDRNIPVPMLQDLERTCEAKELVLLERDAAELRVSLIL
ncbi:valine--tRNA ligase [Anaplasma bovis]|uniref:valine--tRNA ligase n=1 Tax=Anaplasma bovis TaxID=186733 RepID=UPI002FEF28C3